MRVLLLGDPNSFKSDSGAGISRYMYELYNGLKQYEKANLSVEKCNYPKITCSSISDFILYQLVNNFSEYDIVHNLAAMPIIKPKSMIRTKVVSTAHDFGILLHKEYYIDKNTDKKTIIWYWLVKIGLLSILKSDYVIAVSTQTRDELVKLGYSKSKITTISEGVDRRFIEEPINKKQMNNFVFGYIGSFQKNKNIRFAIESIRYFNKNILFKIYGKPNSALSLTKNNRRIKFMGFAPENQLISIYDSFDAFVFPSLYEGFGLPILEAQSRGLPVIIYKYGKIPKEVRKYCFEAESPEHMAQIIENLKENGYNEKLRKKATEYARSFTYEKEVKETLEVYKLVLR